MRITPELQQYFDFLGWFHQNHPTLNKDYWQHITIPEPGKGVGIFRSGLERFTLDQLQSITQKYYMQESTTGNHQN